MNNSDNFETFSDIIFKHQISIKDLTGKIKFSIVFIGFLLAVIVSVAFYSPNLLKNFASFLFFKSWLFFFVIAVFDLILTILFTKAKVVLTKNSIFYKPPVSFKIYSLNFDEIDGVLKNRFYLTVLGKNPQKRFTVFLYGKSASEFLSVLEKSVECLKDLTPKKTFDFASIYDKYFLIFFVAAIFVGFCMFPSFLILKEKIGDYYFFEWQKSGYSEEIYRKCAEKNYKTAVLNERNKFCMEKYLKTVRK